MQQTNKTDYGFVLRLKGNCNNFLGFSREGKPTSHKSGHKSLWHNNGNNSSSNNNKFGSANVIAITEITAMRVAIEMEYAVECIIEREFQHPCQAAGAAEGVREVE